MRSHLPHRNLVAIGDEMSDNNGDIDPNDFQTFIKQYQKNPTIENYVSLSRKYPHIHFDISTPAALNFFSHEKKNWRLTVSTPS